MYLLLYLYIHIHFQHVCLCYDIYIYIYIYIYIDNVMYVFIAVWIYKFSFPAVVVCVFSVPHVFFAESGVLFSSVDPLNITVSIPPAALGALGAPGLTPTFGLSQSVWGRDASVRGAELTSVTQAAPPALLAHTLPRLLTRAVPAAGEGHALLTVLSLPSGFAPEREERETWAPETHERRSPALSLWSHLLLVLEICTCKGKHVHIVRTQWYSDKHIQITSTNKKNIYKYGYTCKNLLTYWHIYMHILAYVCAYIHIFEMSPLWDE